VDVMKANVADLLKGIDRYNPENLQTLEHYVEMQARENVYDPEANLAVLKLYQFNPTYFQTTVVAQILLKALTNLPYTDFTLCKRLIDVLKLEDEPLSRIIELGELLETCQFKQFWGMIRNYPDIIVGIVGFEDNIRKFICHVVSITYQTIQKDVLTELLGGIQGSQVNQWIGKYGWRDEGNGEVFVGNQEDLVKTKNITEKISFENVAAIMASTASVARGTR
jgi:translation initiation factor 3 subunit K